jgi:hypothetical protein
MTDDEKLIRLAESNMELSLMLLGNRKDTRDIRNPPMITYLFGRPLNEIYDIIVKYEQENK